MVQAIYFSSVKTPREKSRTDPHPLQLYPSTVHVQYLRLQSVMIKFVNQLQNKPNTFGKQIIEV